MNKIGIIGAGGMGSGIAQKTAQEGLSVVMVDVQPDFVQRGLDMIKATLSEAVERKILTPEKVDGIMGRVHGTTDFNDTKDCDLIIEAVFEDMDVKKDVFARLDAICEAKTILATNTSSLSIDEMATVTNRPDRFVGLHFFYHPAKNRLLEIIPGSLTSPETTAACKRYAELTGKTDIVVKDAAGFAVNRFFVPWLNEATRILEEGITNIATIEKAGKDSLGIGMGPFQLMNVTGIPIAFHASSSLGEAFGPFYVTSDRLKEQLEAGELWPLQGHVEEDKLETVSKRLLGTVFYVATSLLEEGVAGIADTDIGAKVGLRWRKGPFELMNSLGIEKAYSMVEDLLEAWPDLAMPEALSSQRAKGEPWDIRYVRYSRDGDIGRVIISRPDAMNALNETVVKQLGEAFAQAEADSATTAIIIQATGKAFVSGADIGFFVDCIKENRLDDNVDFTTRGQEILNRIDQSPKLVVAKMDGLALGGGLELALATDIIVTTPKVMIGFPETGIGIYPGMGGTQRTSRYIGKELAKYLVLTGRLISGAEAVAIGLADYVFDPMEIDEKIEHLIAQGTLIPKKGKKTEELSPEWRTIRELFTDDKIDAWLSGAYADSNDPIENRTAKMLAKRAPLALKFANKIIDTGYDLPLLEGLKEELAHLIEIFSTADALTGLTSVGRGSPKFEGR